MNLDKIKSISKTGFWFVFLPLLLGSLIYVMARDSSIYFLQFLPIKGYKIELPYWVQYHLPDGLWAFTFSALVALVWEDVQSTGYYVWLGVLVTVSIGLEVFYGTFDWYDLVFILIGIGGAYWIFKRKK
ncbi:hypothetical protein QNH98_06100 [Myroides sp. mNGS23_01]|nr:hypothetical protein [Myroides sp. mNGS23_01]WHT40189.1 hypothetical protein QNH98_06100 [Myroides sp. mNGS23_01]